MSEILASEEAIDGYIESFISGAFIGGVANVGNATKSAVKGTDYRNGVTANEQGMIDTLTEKKSTETKKTHRAWLPYAVASAVFASLTSILAKVGISGVESNLGTAIRTGVVLIMAWIIVLIKKKQPKLLGITVSIIKVRVQWKMNYIIML